MRRSLPKGLLALPAAAMIFLFIVLPYINVLVMSLRMPGNGTPYAPGYTLKNYADFFRDPYYFGTLLNTLWLGVLTTVICLLLALPVAFAIARSHPRFRAVLYALVLSPLLVGIVVRSYGWTILLGNAGIINGLLKSYGLIDRPLPLMYNSFGIVLALAHVFLPFMVLPMLSAIQAIDPALASAARSLGASRLKAFWRVTLPLAMPGIRSGLILVFVLAVSSYVTPALIGGMRVKTMTVMVVDTLLDEYRWPFGSAMALCLALAAGIVVAIFGRLTRMRWKP